MTFGRLEERWAEAMLASFAPQGFGGLSPKVGEVDFRASLRRFCRRLSWRAFWGLRLAIWMVAASPIWLWRRARAFADLSVEERSHLLHELLSHRSSAIRGLTKLLKLQAALAIFATPSLRARSGYDTPMDASERPRRSLPVIVDGAA